MTDSARPLTLKGSLLLADPSLRDQYFYHSVLLLTEHDKDQGAVGYVLNKPYGKKVGDILMGEEFAGLHSVPIFIGGPVSREHLVFAALQWKIATKRLTVQTHLSAAEAMQRQENGEIIRAFLGYSGWGSGQLEHEMRENAWITRPAASQVLEGESNEKLWKMLLTSLGPVYELRSHYPASPWFN